QQNFSAQDKRGKLRLVLSPEGTDGSLELRQDARVYAGLFDGNETAGVDIAADRFAYVHVARGSVKLNGVELNEGDGARIRNERRLEFTEGQDAEVLVFDLRNNEVSELWS
ncbi:MAG: quercetin 2,3-dioxygenase, partial [Paraburkholderia hospita]